MQRQVRRIKSSEFGTIDVVQDKRTRERYASYNFKRGVKVSEALASSERVL